MNVEQIKEKLINYDGPEVNIMEVCGSHTGAIAKNGIPDLLSKKINLISGPGCPVCVTPSSYIDRLIDLAVNEGKVIVTFGDLLRVPGSTKTLSQAKGEGADVRMIYSPMDILKPAMEEPEKEFIFAAIGFETTTPVYALLLEEIIDNDLSNVKLLTAIKTMPEVIDYLCRQKTIVNAFLAPGHVSVIIGSNVYIPLATKYNIPFGVAGFEAEEILEAICGIVTEQDGGSVRNYYVKVVTEKGNETATGIIEKYFEKGDAVWRGMGNVPDSGRYIRPEYERYDAGSRFLDNDVKKNKACCCDKVLLGVMRPNECPLFGKVCSPLNPQGACMVSTEGSCFSYYSYGR